LSDIVDADAVDEVAAKLRELLGWIQGASVSVPPPPPATCYGRHRPCLELLEGLGAAAELAAAAAAEMQAAAQDLSASPVKVLLPWYPAAPVERDVTKPLKVMPGR